MKSSLKKLRGFALIRKFGHSKEKISSNSPTNLPDPLSKADHLKLTGGLTAINKEKSSFSPVHLSENAETVTVSPQVAEGMKDQYDNLLAVAQAVSGASFDFSRALQDMTSHMLDMFEKTSDGETATVFSMLAKVQYEISKLLDTYATHISQTIIRPTENILKEIQSFEEVKRECEEKRNMYDETRVQEAKVQSKKGENQLLTLKEQLNKQEIQLDIRFKSLKHGQELSLMTQAVRHYTAQCHFFKRSLNSLNAVESLVETLSQKLKIDRTLNDDNLETVSGTVDMKNSEADLYSGGDAWKVNTNFSKSAPLFPSGTRNGVGTEEFSVQKLPQKEATKYALPNPKNTRVREHDQPTVRFDTNVVHHPLKEDVYDREGPQENGRINVSSEHVIDSPMNFSHKEDIDTSSMLKHNQSQPRYGHSGPLQSKAKMHNKQSIGNFGDVLADTDYHHGSQLNRTSVFVLPRISPYTSPIKAGLSGPIISELHKLPIPPKRGEPSLPHIEPSGLNAVDPLPLFEMKTHSLHSSVTYSKSLHRSTSLGDSPIIEFPP